MDDYKGQLRRKNRRLRCETDIRAVLTRDGSNPIICLCGYREDPPKKTKTRIVRKNIKKNDRIMFESLRQFDAGCGSENLILDYDEE